MIHKDKIKNAFKKIVTNKIIWGIMAIILPFIIELYKFEKIDFNMQMITRVAYIYGIYIALGIFWLLNKFSKTVKKICDFIMKYRYVIAGILFVLMVIFKVNFSSIGMWSQYMNEPDTSNEVLGEARGIRSDEWLTQSSFMIGQASSKHYDVHNKNIAEGTGNMLMISAPVSDVLEICRPLLWGFHFLSVERGFSFYWCLKMIALVLVSIELVRIITRKDNSLLVLVGGITLAIAPPMMWWMSTAVVDSYIYGAATIVLFCCYMNHLDYKIWKKLLLALGIIICLPGFAFMLYPAFQVPFGFLMAIFMLNSLIKNWRKLKKSDYLIISITLIAVGVLVSRFVMLSLDDIKTMMGTVYPGKRMDLGGSLDFNYFIGYTANIFFPYTEQIVNTCEPSTYIYSFTGLVILGIAFFKDLKNEKKSNFYGLTLALIVLYIVYLVWEFVGFNSLLAKLSLLYFSPAPRTHIITGIIGIVLSIMLIERFKDNKLFSKSQAIIISLVVALFSYIMIRQSIYNSFFTLLKYEIVLAMVYCLTYFSIKGKVKQWAFVMFAVAIMAGVKVNPVSVGIGPVTKTDISNQIKSIVDKDEDALWIGSNNITGQYLIANGANSLNGVHTYPSFKWLNIVDPEKKYNDVYNRFAHISINLSDEMRFDNIAPDAYVANLTYQNLKDLNVKYYFSLSKVSDEDAEMFHLNIIYSDEDRNQYIYEIN